MNVDKISENLLIEAKAMEVSITDKLLDIRDKMGYNGQDIKLVDLHSRFKTVDSIKRKVKNIGMGFSDCLRYTIILKDDSFVEDLITITSYLQNEGMYIKKCRNAWTEDFSSYFGINLIIQFGMYQFEIQVHTEESREFRNSVDHKRYELIKYSDMSTEEKYKLRIKSFKEAMKLKSPNGVDEISITILRGEESENTRNVF